MFRFRHFAAPAVLGTALLIGGCAHERHDVIPLSATPMDEGKETVTFTAPYDGQVYVYDSTSEDMLYQGKLRHGQVVRVDAEENRVLIDNQTAVEKDLVNDHRFKIFFDRDESAAAASHVIVPPGGQTTVVTPPAAGATVKTEPNAPRTNINIQPAPAAEPQTNIRVQPAPAEPRTNIQVQPAPSEPRTNIQVQPAPSEPRTTIETTPGDQTTVTTPEAKVTTDPETGRTTVQPE